MATATASNARRFKLSKFILSWYGILIVYALMVGLFLLLRLGDGNTPVALSIGSLTFRWYGIIITGGVIVASFLAQFLAERRGDDPDHVWRILPVLLVFGIVFARIWYVFNTWEGYKDYFFSIGNPTHAGAIEIWRGGIAIQGAVAGGIIGALVYGLIYNRMQVNKGSSRRFSLWRFSDFVAPGLVLAQGIGRWGNFMNNEAYGRQTQLPWGIKIPCEYRTSGATPGTDNTLCPNTYLPNGQIATSGIEKDALFHPTFFYESLWNYFTFLVLFFCIMRPKTIERRFKVKLRDGDIFLLYWVVYSIGRFFTEGFRTDSLYFMGNTGTLRTAQVIAIVSILVAGFLLFYRHRKPFPTTEALSMRLAPFTVGGQAGVAVPADAPVKGLKTAAVPRKETVVATDEAAAIPVDQDDEFDELDQDDLSAASVDEDEATEMAEEEADKEADEMTATEATAEAGRWPDSQTPGSAASPAGVEAAMDETDTEAARTVPLEAGPDAQDTSVAVQVEGAAVEDSAPESQVELGSMVATFEPTVPEAIAAPPVAPEVVTRQTAPGSRRGSGGSKRSGKGKSTPVQTNPVSGVIENVAEPVVAAPVPGEVPPPAVDTDPKAVDVDLSEQVAPEAVAPPVAPEAVTPEAVTPTLAADEAVPASVTETVVPETVAPIAPGDEVAPETPNQAVPKTPANTTKPRPNAGRTRRKK